MSWNITKLRAEVERLRLENRELRKRLSARGDRRGQMFEQLAEQVMAKTKTQE